MNRPDGNRNVKRASRWKAASLIAGAALAGCAQEAALVVSEPGPLALHVLPGAGFSLTSARTLYLVVATEDLRARSYLPELSTIIASELRTASGVDVVPIVDPGLDRQPCSSWRDTCQQYGLPVAAAEPGAAVVVCDLQEIDPYSPLRVGLALTVRRVDDGLNLAGVQGVWVGPPDPPVPPRHSFWSLPRIKPPAAPDRDWTEVVESGTSLQLMRQAARDAVQSLLLSPTGTGSSVVPMMPPVDLEPLVEDVPPMPAPEPGPSLSAPGSDDEWINESAGSVPAEPDLSL